MANSAYINAKVQTGMNSESLGGDGVRIYQYFETLMALMNANQEK